MSRYAPDSRDRVYDAVDMVGLVGTRVELRRAGVDSYFGNCPFHDERTGSFHVTPDKKVYHCFGCQASGDPFTFVQETEGVDFKGALESLATRFGVALEVVDEDPKYAAHRRRQDRLFELLARTTTYYDRYLWEAGEAGEAREYLAGRGLTEETLRAFRVGYAPNSWDRILTGSRRAGYAEDELLAVGLIRRSERSRAGAFDFFREQIMFPAADARGRVHGFGARRMREEQRLPKYVNTPDGDLYHKREVLFGIDKARGDAAKAGRMILVEGYTDVLALHQAGIRNAVGIMGTSFTKEQLDELQKTVKVLELCLDADSAGQEAVMRAARLAVGASVELRVVVLPEGADPADLAQREGAEGLRARVGASVPFVAFEVDRILTRADTRSAEGRDRALTELAPAFAALPPSVLRDELIRRVSSALELSDARLAALLDNPPPLVAGGGGGGAVSYGSAPSATPGSRSERFFLALCIAVPAAGTKALAGPEVEQLLPTEVMRRVARHLRERTATPLTELPSDDEAFARVVSGLVELAGRVPEPSPDRLEHTRLVLELERLDRAVLRARAAGEGTNELAREREGVREAYRQVVSRMEGDSVAGFSSVRPECEHTFVHTEEMARMDENSLRLLLAQGVSVEEIGRRFNRDASTIAYWMKKFGLQAPNRARYAAKGGFSRETLEALVENGMSIAEIAQEIDRGKATVRYWLRKHGLRTKAGRRANETAEARADLLLEIERECARHGMTRFVIEGRGYYRCRQCRLEQVAEHRRRRKLILVEEAGGRCILCGYDSCVSALEFHHLDPSEKRLGIAAGGLSHSLETLRAEIAKCVLLCSNCHAEVESGVCDIVLK